VAERDSGRTAFVAGIAFVVAGVAFLLEGLGAWDLELEMLGPALLIGLGVVVLLGGRGGRAR
jgi:hypothetical protein